MTDQPASHFEFRKASVAPNGSCNFTFEKTIQSYVVGISHFNLTFGDDDYSIENISIHLTPNKTSKQIRVTAHATFNDAQGHTINIHNSTIDVVCLAQTNTPDGMTTLANDGSIQSGSQGMGIPLISNAPSLLYAVLSGFNLSFGSSENRFLGASASAGARNVGSTAHITGTADMYNGKGLHAMVATIDGGLISSGNADESGLIVRPFNDEDKSGETFVSIPFIDKDVGAAVFLQEWTVQFAGNDHPVRNLHAGCLSWEVQDGGVMVKQAEANVHDDDGHKGDIYKSNVSMMVVGTQKLPTHKAP
jgi:hypothetical protein